MNSLSRLHHRLRGEPVDKIPDFNIMMTFAAHFIKQPLAKYYLDHRVLCEANLAVLEAFDLDIVQAISDPYREAADLGAKITFPNDALPICETPLLIVPEDLTKLKPVSPQSGRRMNDRLEAIRSFREQVGDEVPIMGWVEGALAEAADLRGVNQLLLDLYDRPEWVFELLEFCCEVDMAFAQAQVEAGAHIIGLGDAIASQINPAAYRRFALPYEQRIFAEVHRAGAMCRLHICGDTTRILPDMAESGADIIDIDWMVDMKAAADAFVDRAAVCGNQDPTSVMLRGTPELVLQKVENCMQAGGSRCLSAAGCEIPDRTPHANLLAQSKVLERLAGR